MFGSMEGASTLPVHSDDLGRFRIYGLEPGTYVVAAEGERGPRPTTGQAEEGFVRTYHPSSFSELGAAKVQVLPSFDRSGIDIQLVRSRRFHVAGTILNSHGQAVAPARAALVRATIGGHSSTGVPVDAQGRFVVRDLEPGDYHLDVRVSAQVPLTASNEFA